MQLKPPLVEDLLHNRSVSPTELKCQYRPRLLFPSIRDTCERYSCNLSHRRLRICYTTDHSVHSLKFLYRHGYFFNPYVLTSRNITIRETLRSTDLSNCSVLSILPPLKFHTNRKITLSHTSGKIQSIDSSFTTYRAKNRISNSTMITLSTCKENLNTSIIDIRFATYRKEA